jgi:hypothetical protein
MQISRLPTDIRIELNRQIIAAGFEDYEPIASWLGEAGFAVSVKLVAKHGQELADQFDGLKQTRELALSLQAGLPEGSGADSQLLNSVVTGLILRNAIAVQEYMEAPQTEEYETLEETSRLVWLVSRSISDLNRNNVALSKFVEEQKVAQATRLANVLAKTGQGISPEFIEMFKTEVLGL